LHTTAVSGLGIRRLSTLYTAVSLPASTPASQYVTLWTYTIPANTLTRNGDALRFLAFGRFPASAPNRRVQFKFGTTVLSTLQLTNPPVGVGWAWRSTLVRSNQTDTSYQFDNPGNNWLSAGSGNSVDTLGDYSQPFPITVQ